MVSIIIVHYNTFDLTYLCIESCLRFTKGISFEIILVNNGSDEKPLDELAQAFPSVNIVEAGGNIGFAKGNNLGIQVAKGEYILLLNSDCELTEDSISKAVETLNSDQNIGVLTTKLIFANGQVQNNYQSFPSISGDLLELTRLFKLINKEKYAREYENRLLDSKQDHYCDWVWGAFFLFRKVDVQLLQGQQLSDRFFMYGEDTEWCYQFKEINKRCYYLSSTSVIHHMGQSGFGSDGKKWRTIIGNEIKTVRKFKGTLYSIFFRFFRASKYLLSFRKQGAFLAKLYLSNTN